MKWLSKNWRLSAELLNIFSDRCIVKLVNFLPFWVLARTMSFSMNQVIDVSSERNRNYNAYRKSTSKRV